METSWLPVAISWGIVPMGVGGMERDLWGDPSSIPLSPRPSRAVSFPKGLPRMTLESSSFFQAINKGNPESTFSLLIFHAGVGRREESDVHPALLASLLTSAALVGSERHLLCFRCS